MISCKEEDKKFFIRGENIVVFKGESKTQWVLMQLEIVLSFVRTLLNIEQQADVAEFHLIRDATHKLNVKKGTG